jgi:hypothetical protein
VSTGSAGETLIDGALANKAIFIAGGAGQNQVISLGNHIGVHQYNILSGMINPLNSTSQYSIIGPAAITMADIVPLDGAPGSVADSLNAARADGFGKWVLSGTTLTLYGPDNTTVVRTFTLPSATDPLSRS